MSRGFHSCEHTSTVDTSRSGRPTLHHEQRKCLSGSIIDRGSCPPGSISSQGPKDCRGLLKEGDFIFSNGGVPGSLGEKKMVSEKGNRIAESNWRNHKVFCVCMKLPKINKND